MIDHLLAFATEPDAFNDPIVGQYHELGTKGNPPRWHPEANPNMLVWNPADDTIKTVPGPDGDRQVPVHHPIDTQFRVVITLLHPDPDLVDHPNLELAADHVMGRVIGGTFDDTQLQTLAMQPVFFGSAYPFLTDVRRGLGRRSAHAEAPVAAPKAPSRRKK